MKRIAIVGGGFTGLAAAYELASSGMPVTVFEKESQVGGLAGSFRAGQSTLEKFYHHWFTSDRYIFDLVKRLGVEDRIVRHTSRTGMYYAHRFFKLTSPLDVLRFTALNPADRLRLGFGILRVRRVRHWRDLESLTARDWLIDVFGKRIYEVMWEPLLVGKFGDAGHEISAVWFWNKLKLRGGSRGQGGAEQLVYYRGGFSGLAQKLAGEIKRLGGEITTDAPVTELDVQSRRVRAVQGIQTEAVLFTTPLPIAADLLAAHAGPAYIAQLRRIRHLANVCLVLELDCSLSSLYWINVNDPSFPFVGVIEHTNFEPASCYAGRHIVYLSKYLPDDAALYRMPDDELLDYSIAALQRMFPAFRRESILAYHVWRAGYAQPIVERNYSALIPPLETPLENVFLATMAQVYPEDRGTNYAVRNGLAAAEILKRFVK